MVQWRKCPKGKMSKAAVFDVEFRDTPPREVEPFAPEKLQKAPKGKDSLNRPSIFSGYVKLWGCMLFFVAFAFGRGRECFEIGVWMEDCVSFFMPVCGH